MTRLRRSGYGALRAPVLLVLAVMAMAVTAEDRAATAQDRAGAAQVRPSTTSHPALPARLSQYWLVPDSPAGRAGRRRADTAAERFARGAKQIADGHFAAGLPLVSAADLSAQTMAINWQTVGECTQ